MNFQEMSYPSIFNDVLGPVMRGPSSSHCAAALRIGRLCNDLMEGQIKDVVVEYDPNGSLATTHKSQGSDMGLFGGLLGWSADDERLPNYLQGIEEAGIQIQINIVPVPIEHPNVYKITLFNEKEMHELIAISTGGGMIEVLEIDGAKVQQQGDYFVTLLYWDEGTAIMEYLQANFSGDFIEWHQGNRTFIEVKAQSFLPTALKEQLHVLFPQLVIKELHPVLPIMARQNVEVPFYTCAEMLAYNEEKELDLWELAVQYESLRGNIAPAEVFEKMRAIVRIMEGAIENGLKGTSYKDRILGPQSLTYKEKLEDNRLVDSGILNQIIMSVSAIMEVKSAMGVIVAAPTAGSCGALPGTILGAVSALNLPEEEAVKAMLAAGMIGLFIAAHASFAAEVGGCQAECGSGSGMAAAGLVHLAGGNLQQALAAASMALQNSLGMICDPIANRVEAPCLGRNTMAASNALTCANMALANYDHLIPLDEVIDTMDKVGKSIAHELRCTALGGLSITETSKAIEARLNGGQPDQQNLAQTARQFKIC